MDNNKNFFNLINKDKYQVFIMCCPAYIPFNFFRHPWIVLNEKGEVSRWEIRHYLNKNNKNHLFVDEQLPFEGINQFPYIKSKWDAEILKIIDGELAEKIIDIVKTSKSNYPFCNKYCFSGPNSNTYISWVWAHFPQLDLNLSNRFIGKNYKIKVK